MLWVARDLCSSFYEHTQVYPIIPQRVKFLINSPDSINNNNFELVRDLRHERGDLLHQSIHTALATSLENKHQDKLM